MNLQIGEKISELRKKHKMSQDELASKLNVSRQAVSNWERGESLPEVDKLIAISDLYSVSMDYLTKGETAKKGGYPNQKKKFLTQQQVMAIIVILTMALCLSLGLHLDQWIIAGVLLITIIPVAGIIVRR